MPLVQSKLLHLGGIQVPGGWLRVSSGARRGCTAGDRLPLLTSQGSALIVLILGSNANGLPTNLESICCNLLIRKHSTFFSVESTCYNL